jgi:hypothetical protein
MSRRKSIADRADKRQQIMVHRLKKLKYLAWDEFFDFSQE